MEQKFEIGDWVLHSGIPFLSFNGVKQIKKIKDDRASYLIDNQWLVENQLKLWTPTEGEWCWFWDHNDLPFLLQSTGEIVKTPNGYLYFSKQKQRHGNDASSNCEPFIGELPTFVKEK